MAAQPYHERLSGLDGAFLALETTECPMHIGAVLILEPGPLCTTRGGVDFDRICEHIEARLHHLPRYRQRLAYTPIERRPIWIDDPDFNLRYHLRHTALPRPGDDRQLKRLCGRIFSQNLDREKPLWEIWLVEGLKKRRIAMITKVHHCMTDGMGGVELLTQLLSQSPDVQHEVARPWTPRPAPGPFQLIGETLVERAKLSLSLGRSAVAVLRSPRTVLAAPAQQLKVAWQMLGRAIHPASRTSLNRPVGQHRRFDWLSMDLDAVRRVKTQLGGSLNDVVLTIISGALRRLFLARQTDVRWLDCRVFAPVSTRSEERHGTLGNHVSFWLVDLPVCETDPLQRLRRIREQTVALKSSRQLLCSELIAGAASLMGPKLLSAGADAVMRLRPFNHVVTNIRGPQSELFLLGSRVVDIYPLVPIYGNLGLDIALFSYTDRLCWGLNSDWDQTPDLHELVLALETSLQELEQLGSEAAPRPPLYEKSAAPRVAVESVAVG